MRWPTVIPATVVEPIKADADVRSVLGNPPAFFMVGEREFAVQSMRWTLVANTEGELYEESLVQLDFWVRSVEQAVTLLGALRRLLHRETEYEVGNIKLWSTFTEERAVRTMRDGIVEGSLDFRLTYLRGRYAA